MCYENLISLFCSAISFSFSSCKTLPILLNPNLWVRLGRVIHFPNTRRTIFRHATSPWRTPLIWIYSNSLIRSSVVVLMWDRSPKSYRINKSSQLGRKPYPNNLGIDFHWRSKRCMYASISLCTRLLSSYFSHTLGSWSIYNLTNMQFDEGLQCAYLLDRSWWAPRPHMGLRARGAAPA